RCERRLRARIGGERIVALELAKGAVVGVDVCARGNVVGRKADDLPVFANRLPLGDARDGELVAARHARARADACNLLPGLDRVDGDDDIVARIEPQRARTLPLRGWLHGWAAPTFLTGAL